jgi:hypothetical protein
MSSTPSYTPISRVGHVDREPVPRSKRMGRPTDFEPHMVAMAAALARHGATDEEITEELGISTATFYRWYHEMPDFREAVRNAKDGPDERVKRSLFKSALEGNSQAQQFWLKNRKRADWNAASDVNVVVPMADAPQLDAEQTDVRTLALAAIALIREAPDAPVIEGEIRHAPHTSTQPPDPGRARLDQPREVRGSAEDWAGPSPGQERADLDRPRRSRRAPRAGFDL